MVFGLVELLELRHCIKLLLRLEDLALKGDQLLA